MRPRQALAILAITIAMTWGCNRRQETIGQAGDRSNREFTRLETYARLQRGIASRGFGAGLGPAMAMSPMVISGGTVYAAESQRFVATRHTLEIISTESNLQKSWQAVVDYCASISCEVLSSNITNKTENVLPSGHIALRVRPDDLNKLMAFVGSQGRVTVHSTESEDKTGQVVDTEAKIKNLTVFRDNLRSMLSRPSVTVKDSIEIQSQLTDVQAQLDSETAGRKALANETEKVAVDIAFRVDVPRSEIGGWRQIWNALRDSGSILAESTAWLIMAVMTLLPWVVVIVPLLWLIVRRVQRWRKHSQAVQMESKKD